MRVMLYTRVSTDEQADRGYSLRDQEARLRAHCEREGWAVVGHHQDDHSAKTFERPSWSALLGEIEAGPSAVDQVLVVKWDRFSRDATGALGMIRRLEALGVGVQAIEQPIDRAVPEQLMMLAIYVAAPEVENRRRSIATKQGMRRAMREGRYVSAPPKGYRRGLDAEGRYLIEPNGDAEHVREAFRLAAETDVPVNAIARRLRKAGFRCSNNQMHLMLRNPLYAGRIVIPAWRRGDVHEPEVEVEGVHESLVSSGEFDRVQRRFERPGPTAGRRRKVVPELPLKGHLLDPETWGVLTGSGSRSRHGYRVWYYHGRGKGAYRIGASEAHEAFGDLLASVEIAPEVAALYRAMAEEDAAEERQAGARRRRRLRERAEVAESKLLRVDEMWIEGEIERDSYARLKAKWSGELREARAGLSEDAPGLSAQVGYAVGVLSRLCEVWAGATVEARSALVGSIFPAGLVVEGERCRTPEPSALIALFCGETAKTQDGDATNGAAVLAGTPGRTLFEPIGGAERAALAGLYARRELIGGRGVAA
jgi:DNA invertase Pin-like site-specific DNA recombinase